MSRKQPTFFMSSEEVFQKEFPDRFKKSGTKGSRKKSAPKVFDCSTCGLKDKCRNPDIPRLGKGKKGILIVDQSPDRVVDRRGAYDIGAVSAFLGKNLKRLDLDVNEDCIRTSVVRCYPGADNRGRDKKVSKDQIKCCLLKLEKDIREVQPRMIICLGTIAIQAVLKTTAFKSTPTVEMTRGKVFPYHKFKCWVGCIHRPSFFLSRKNKSDQPNDDLIFTYDLANIVSYLDDPLPQPLTSEGNECITNVDEAVAVLEYYCNSEEPVIFDYEANMLDSFHVDAELKSVSITNDVESASFIPIGLKGIFNVDEQARIILAMKNFLSSDAPKVVQNYYMEELWGRNHIGQGMNHFIHDTMVAAHVINCHPRTTGLGFQAFEMTGSEYKGMINIENLEEEPLEVTCNYNCWDSRYTLMSYKNQKSLLVGNLRKFNDFLTRSLISLANYKYRGIQINEQALKVVEDDFKAEMKECLRVVEDSAPVKKYNVIAVSKDKEPFKITSSSQVGTILYDICGVKITPKRKTPSGKGGTAKVVFEEILSTTENDTVRRILTNVATYRRSVKVIERATEYRRLVDADWFVHPSFNLNIARSYRSSADGPNIQNVFKHDDRQKTFRRCIVPRPGHIFLEPDYSGAEICVAAMISKDPILIAQVQAGMNIHWLWASRIFDREGEEYTQTKEQKKKRNKSKNGFYFPSIYGATPESIARSLQLDVDFVRGVQKRFWEEYHFIREWQKKTIHDYEMNGYVELVSGGRRPGPLNINKLYNTPIQGPAYHLLQDAGNRIDEELINRKFRTMLIAEIHDANILDTHVDEMEEVIELSEKIMCAKRFDWQGDVPMSVEWEVGVKNWYEMEAL